MAGRITAPPTTPIAPPTTAPVAAPIIPMILFFVSRRSKIKLVCFFLIMKIPRVNSFLYGNQRLRREKNCTQAELHHREN